jgi:hypothetical protein
VLAVIIGRRRQGKSTLAYALALRFGETIIVFDPNNQFGALPAIEDVPGFLETGGRVGKILPPAAPEDAWAELTAELDGGGWQWGEYTLIADECSMLMSAHYLDPQTERYARTAPKDVRLLMTTHRASDLNPLIRALASDWFIFQTSLERDLKAITDQFGVEVSAAVRNLPPYHVLHYWLDSGGVPRFEVWDKPAEWYVDIGRTT